MPPALRRISRRTHRRCVILYSILRLTEIGNGIANYANGKEGSLDDRGKAEVNSISGRLGEIAVERHDSQVSITAARTEYVKTLAALKDSIVRGRRILDAAAVGTKAGPRRPKAVKGMFLASRIGPVAIEHLQELEAIAGDPAVPGVVAGIKAAKAAFDEAYAALKSAASARRTLLASQAEELTVITGKLAGYRTFVTYNVPSADRKDLKRLLRDLVRPRTSGPAADTAEAEPATVDATTATLSTMPTVPTTVPPSSEHPSISANA